MAQIFGLTVFVRLVYLQNDFLGFGGANVGPLIFYPRRACPQRCKYIFLPCHPGFKVQTEHLIIHPVGGYYVILEKKEILEKIKFYNEGQVMSHLLRLI